jgi:hypothetical protein
MPTTATATTTTTTTFTSETTPMPMTTPLTTTPHRSNPMPSTTITRRRPTPTPETTPMPTASLLSSPANDITASSKPFITPEKTMTAALALETVKTTPTLTLVHSVPLQANANSNAATPQRAPRPPFELEELRLLRPSQVHHVAAQEIEFFFTSDPDADAGAEDPDGAIARAAIASWMAELDPRDQEALALYYEPEPWPDSILEEGLDYTSGYALVLSRASASVWRRNGRRSYTAEQAANQQLRAAVLERGPRALRHLTRRAEWDYATALRAYAKARGRAPSVLDNESRASSASEES